jgi:hypothetical protein
MCFSKAVAKIWTLETNLQVFFKLFCLYVGQSKTTIFINIVKI